MHVFGASEKALTLVVVMYSDRDVYRSMLEDLSATECVAAEATCAEALTEATRVEAELTAELERLRRERAALKAEQLALEDESKSLQVLEARFWDEYQQLQLELDAVGCARRSCVHALFIALPSLLCA